MFPMRNEPSKETILLMTLNADTGCGGGGTGSFAGLREKGNEPREEDLDLPLAWSR